GIAGASNPGGEHIACATREELAAHLGDARQQGSSKEMKEDGNGARPGLLVLDVEDRAMHARHRDQSRPRQCCSRSRGAHGGEDRRDFPQDTRDHLQFLYTSMVTIRRMSTNPIASRSAMVATSTYPNACANIGSIRSGR